MNRLKNLFARKNKNVLNVYCTAGFPKLDSTLEVLKALQDGGADIIELGMPYSDPLADGEVIQQSSNVALKNGMTMQLLFEQLKNLRKSPSAGGIGGAIPVILMGYMNPVLQYGFEKFCAGAASAGIDGLILPDLPQHEFEATYGKLIKKYGLDFIFLITPETSAARVKRLDELSSGFLYAVSSSSTTGKDKDFADVEKYLQRIQTYGLKNPVLAGFGVKDKNTFQSVSKYASGAIIGTAYISALQKANNIEAATKNFLNEILK